MIRARESKSAPVGVVTKVLHILETLHDAPQGLQLKDVALQTGINKSTAYRFLAHLEHEGYVFRDTSGAYAIGVRLARLASGTSYQTTLRKISRPILQQLWRATGETVNLAVLDGREVLYLDVMESSHTFRLVSQVGIRRPVYCRALGKAMLAFIPEPCNTPGGECPLATPAETCGYFPLRQDRGLRGRPELQDSLSRRSRARAAAVWDDLSCEAWSGMTYLTPVALAELQSHRPPKCRERHSPRVPSAPGSDMRCSY